MTELAKIAPGLSGAELVGKAALFGVAGWAMENFLFGQRNSAAFTPPTDHAGAVEAKLPQGRRVVVPFLPVYAVGGAAVMVTAHVVKDLPWPLRGAIYGAGLTGLEYVACQIDRKFLGGKSWDYGGGSCVDWKHALAWGALGLVAERFANVRPRDPGPPQRRGVYR